MSPNDVVGLDIAMRLFDQFRETEIENLRVAITRNHDVFGKQCPLEAVILDQYGCR